MKKLVALIICYLVKVAGGPPKKPVVAGILFGLVELAKDKGMNLRNGEGHF